MCNKALLIPFILILIGCKSQKSGVFENSRIDRIIADFILGKQREAMKFSEFIPPAYSILLEEVDTGCKISIIQDLEIDSSQAIGFFIYHDVPVGVYIYSEACKTLLKNERLSDHWRVLDKELLSGELN